MANRPRETYSDYYPDYEDSRRHLSNPSPPPEASGGMYRRSPPPPPPNYAEDSPPPFRRGDSSEEQRPSTSKQDDMSWEKMGSSLQDFMEKKASDPVTEQERQEMPRFRKRPRPEEMPLWIHGHLVDRKDALLIDMVLNNKGNLKAQLDTCKQAIVGLDHIVEYIDPEGDNPRIYQCNLCHQFRSVTTVITHITGYNHRVRYIASHYPNQAKTYLLPDGKTANRIPALFKMASLRAQELELVYGRGDFTTKHERPSIPDGRLDAEEGDLIVMEGEETKELQKIMTKVKQIKLDTEEDVRLAKLIINDLTDSIIEYKQKHQDESVAQGIHGLLQAGRQAVNDSRNSRGPPAADPSEYYRDHRY